MASPPDGCRLFQQRHAHDFGEYRTLVVEVDHPGSGDAHRYADQVETGLGSWIEAGFTPPVVYHDSQPIRVRSLDSSVLRALAVTRPDPDGRFPIADFAILHANLAVAFPRLATRVHQRSLGDAA